MTQQPKGTKPPTTYIGKENSKPGRNVETHTLQVENETKGYLSTTDVEEHSVRDITTHNKEIPGKLPKQLTVICYLRQDRRK